MLEMRESLGEILTNKSYTQAEGRHDLFENFRNSGACLTVQMERNESGLRRRSMIVRPSAATEALSYVQEVIILSAEHAASAMKRLSWNQKTLRPARKRASVNFCFSGAVRSD